MRSSQLSFDFYCHEIISPQNPKKNQDPAKRTTIPKISHYFPFHQITIRNKYVSKQITLKKEGINN